MWAVVFLISLAQLAFQTRSNLRTDTDAISNLDGGYFGANFDGLANNLVANADWKWTVTPTSSDSVNVRAANTAAVDLDVDVIFFKLLRLELRNRLDMMSTAMSRAIDCLLLSSQNHSTCSGLLSCTPRRCLGKASCL